MFKRLAELHNNADTILSLHPAQLAFFVETAWCARLSANHDSSNEVGWPCHRSDVYGESYSLPNRCAVDEREVRSLEKLVNESAKDQTWGSSRGIADHLIYAYCVESTGVVDVFQRILFELLHGEKLGVPNEAQNWLRTTEALCFRDPPPYSILAVTSKIRPDAEAVRRNAYYRMFGDGRDKQKPYDYTRADAANLDFIRTLTPFIGEIWIALANINNTSGANPTDISKICELAKRLKAMLLTRRKSGNLSREEFVHVATLSWLHLALVSDTAIVKALKADATSPEQRLFKLAQRVDVKVDPVRAKAYLEIAEPLSDVLIAIERGDFDTPINAASQYGGKDSQGNSLPRYLGDQLQSIITHWETITGGEVKARKVSAAGVPVTA